MAEATPSASSTSNAPNGYSEPIVTPVPEDMIFGSVATDQTHHTAGPIITPAPVDANTEEVEADASAEYRSTPGIVADSETDTARTTQEPAPDPIDLSVQQSPKRAMRRRPRQSANLPRQQDPTPETETPST